VTRTVRSIGFLLVALAAVGAAAGVGQAQEPDQAVVGLEVTGVVDPFVASYVQEGIADAREDGAAAVLLTIDTPGGLDSSMRTIVQAVLNSPIPVLCYVAPEGARAASAGTFVLLSCPVAAMAPGTNVGAAHPVGISGAIELEKAENDAAAYIRSLAERQGRNADWAEDAVRRSVSVSAEEALDLGVVDLIAPDVSALFRAVDGRTVDVAGDEQVTLHTTGLTVERRGLGLGVSILHTLLDPSLAFVFFFLGIIFIVAEFFVPGGVLGVVGGVMLVLSVIALGMLPVQLLGLVLLVASAAFFLLELKLPGTAVGTGLGLVTLVLGGLFLFDPSVPSARVSWGAIVPVALFAGLFSLVVLRAAIRMFHQRSVAGPGRLVGAEGVALTPLGTAGVVLVASEEWSATSVTGPIAKGTRVRVVEVEGLRVKVAPAAHPWDAVTPVTPIVAGDRGEETS
jgi:membrane-bound serine protease (ClpP class)